MGDRADWRGGEKKRKGRIKGKTNGYGGDWQRKGNERLKLQK